MRVVMLTGDGVEHRFVAQTILDAFPEELVGIITAESLPLRARLRGWWRRYSVRQIASRLEARLFRARHGLDERRTRTLARVLFAGSAPPTLPRSDIRHVVPGHNHPRCLELLRQLRPDVIVVYGTGVIRRDVIGMPTKGIVNLHTGLSPWYRGADTIFWPIHNEEPERIGVTVHLLTEAIDGGGVLHTARPALDRDDDEDSLFAKGVRAGSALLVRAVREIAADQARAQPQPPGIGREYRFIDRTAAAERRVAQLVRRGLLVRAAGGTASPG